MLLSQLLIRFSRTDPAKTENDLRIHSFLKNAEYFFQYHYQRDYPYFFREKNMGIVVITFPAKTHRSTILNIIINAGKS